MPRAKTTKKKSVKGRVGNEQYIRNRPRSGYAGLPLNAWKAQNIGNGDLFPSRITNEERMYVLRRNGMINAIIERLCDDSIREWCSFRTDPPKLAEEMQDFIDTFRFKYWLKFLIRYSHGLGSGILLKHFNEVLDNGKVPMSVEPTPSSSVMSPNDFLYKITVIPSTYVSKYNFYNDPTHPKYGLIKSIELSYSGRDNQNTSVEVHDSRFFPMTRNIWEITPEGDSILDPIWNDLVIDYNNKWATGEVLFRTAVPWWILQETEPAALSEYTDSEYSSLQDDLKAMRSGDGAFFEYGIGVKREGPTSLVDPSPYLKSNLTNIASSVRISEQVITGPGGKVLGAQMAYKDYAGTIKSVQNDLITPFTIDFFNDMVERKQYTFSEGKILGCDWPAIFNDTRSEESKSAALETAAMVRGVQTVELFEQHGWTVIPDETENRLLAFRPGYESSPVIIKGLDIVHLINKVNVPPPLHTVDTAPSPQEVKKTEEELDDEMDDKIDDKKEE